MRANGLKVAVLLAPMAWLGGCAIAQSVPPPTRPLREIAREDRGEIVTVRDTLIDLRTGMGRAISTSGPAVPVGPVGVRLPITIGGEKKVEVPGEEMTIRLASGKLISVVQELSSPPFAPGVRVRVQYERVDDPGTRTARIQVVRE